MIISPASQVKGRIGFSIRKEAHVFPKNQKKVKIVMEMPIKEGTSKGVACRIWRV
jgi:hypothetical protein